MKFIKSLQVRVFLMAILVTVAVISAIGIQVNPKAENSIVSIGNNLKVITIGTPAAASGVADYTCDGTDDDVQFQAAINALPNGGGRLEVLGGTYKFANLTTVTIAKPNVTINGVGQSANITGDGVTALFTFTGNNGVVFNLQTDAGGINMGTTVGWSWFIVNNGSAVYDYRNPSYSVVGGVITATTVNAPTGRGSTITIASVNATTNEKNQADYTGDGINDNEIVTAINTISAAYNATGKRGTIQLLGPSFVLTSSVIWKSGVDLEGNGANVTASTTDEYGSFNFSSVVNSHIKNVAFKSQAGTAPTYHYPLAVYGASDQTLVFEDVDSVSGDNTTTADTTVVFDTAHPTFIRGTDYGHNAAQNGTFEVLDDAYPTVYGRRGIVGEGATYKYGWSFLENSHGTYIDIIGIGGSQATSGAVLNLNSTSQTNRSKVIGGYFSASSGNMSAALASYNDNSYVEGAILDAGSGAASTALTLRFSATGDYVNNIYIPSTNIANGKKTILAEGNAASRIKGGIAHQPSFGDTNRGLYIRQNAAISVDGLQVTPEEFSSTWNYDDVDSGRFTPSAVAGQPFYLVSIRVNVINANAGVTVDIGTSANGTQVATAFPLTTVGGSYVAFTRQAVAANGYYYATTSAPVADGDFQVEYTVVTNNVNGNPIYFENTTAGSRVSIKNSSFLANAASDALVVAQVTGATWSADNSIFESMSLASRYAVNLSSALANVPIRNSSLRGELNNVTNLAGQKSKQIGTGAQQTLAHGWGVTPNWENVIVTSNNSTPTACQTAAPDATNIYVTAAVGESWNFVIVGR